jgi:hypothetical protein
MFLRGDVYRQKKEVLMKINRLFGAFAATLTVLTLLASPNLARPQKFTSLLATANRKGTLTVGSEKFDVTAVVVKLKEDGVAEITIITDLQLFLSGTWSSPADPSAAIDLKITGGATGSGATGSGKLLLRPDGKSIASLSLQGSSDTQKRKVQLNFVAD